ncbi:MAG: hypothetical protein IT184_03715 [Acidobacteria bacterium]|nr:hypothetical protein [Acidobacteriota bacterium]
MPAFNTLYLMFVQQVVAPGAGKPIPGVFRLFNGAIFERTDGRLSALAFNGFGAFRGMTDRYADVVVEARLSIIDSRVTADGTDVVTDYNIVPLEILAGDLKREGPPGDIVPFMLRIAVARSSSTGSR